ncbi:MAG: D-2-hydroxyacid dehydrogenase family protein [Hyphomicrobiaceae bacterium]|nr:D-2-hydroxyacid dehydrogenase family protein [Hyphomicrobiaceae bacterium]
MAAIAVLDDYQNVALQLADWSQLVRAHQVKVFNRGFASEDEAAAALADFDILCVMRERTAFRRSLIERLPKLRLMVTTGKRNAAIDMEAAKEKGVLVCYTGGSGHPTAELAFGLMLSLARHIPQEAQNMREGRWQTTVGFDLAGRTLGLLGLGNLGGQVARIATAFGMRLIAWSENLTQARAAECGAARVDKATLFREADIVSIHTVLSKRTRGLVGEADLRAMKPTALLINTSRGPIVEEAALLAALRGKWIAGYGGDVYDVEPLPAEHPLRREPAALLTPHIGYVTEETYRVFYGQTVAAIEAWLAGRPINILG